MHAAPGGPIGLADDEQLVGKLREALQQRDAERPGAEEGDPPEPVHGAGGIGPGQMPAADSSGTSSGCSLTRTSSSRLSR